MSVVKPLTPKLITNRVDFHDYLMQHSTFLTNSHLLACMLASYYTEKNHALLPRLGLSIPAYTQLLATHFPKADLPVDQQFLNFPPARLQEMEDLRHLILNYRTTVDAEWIAEIIVTGCLGDNHLWQDLGLWSRQDLTQLFINNFPQLAAKNNNNMKWKKFLYKQLCNAEGIYVCRAPSCEVCSDYDNCFGPET